MNLYIGTLLNMYLELKKLKNRKLLLIYLLLTNWLLETYFYQRYRLILCFVEFNVPIYSLWDIGYARHSKTICI